MPQQTINLGTTPSDGTGDSVRDAFDKVNDNFTEVYGLAGNAAPQSELDDHVEDTNNPHSVTKSQVGLGNVDNTSDANKPVSTATQAALDGKLDKTDPSVTNARTPTGGAGGVLSGTYPNPGFAVDMATQAELDAVALAKADVSHSHSNASTGTAGFMSASDKSKLDGIAANANNYVLPTPTTTVMGGVKRNAGSAGQFVNGIDASGNLTYGTPAGGSTMTTPRVVYVAGNGNDGTGVVGDPSKPFLTGTAGYNAGYAAAQNFSIEFGQGEYTIDLSGSGLGLSSHCRLLRGRGSNHDQLGMGTQVTIIARASDGVNAHGTAGGTVSVEIAHLHLIVNAQGQHIAVNDEQVYNAGSGGTIKIWGTGKVHAYANGGNLDTLWSGEQGAGGQIELRGVACDAFSVEPGSGPGMTPVLGSLWADGCDLMGASATLDTNSYLLRCSHNTTLTGHTDVGGNAIPW